MMCAALSKCGALSCVWSLEDTGQEVLALDSAHGCSAAAYRESGQISGQAVTSRPPPPPPPSSSSSSSLLSSSSSVNIKQA
eukprot:1156319-Pelagomonas_calceolata.AAC.8